MRQNVHKKRDFFRLKNVIFFASNSRQIACPIGGFFFVPKSDFFVVQKASKLRPKKQDFFRKKMTITYPNFI